jgi:hypothetical protein
MNRDLRIVTPYRPFEPESVEHRALGPFDWVGAIEMLRISVARSCHCETVTITDRDADVPGLRFQYETRSRRLMLWILEVSLCYLASPQFDRNTIMLSPDQLVFGDLNVWFAGDFGITVRPYHRERPILNAVQWWPLAGRDKLIALYEQVFALAKTLPEELIVWGADSEPFRQLLAPIVPGRSIRQGMDVNLIDSRAILHPCSRDVMDALDQGLPVVARKPMVDFRYTRKLYMRKFFDATIGSAVSA